jgi:hypothetical protein
VLKPGARVSSVGLNYLPVNLPPTVDEIAVEPGARVNPSSQPSGPSQQVVINFASTQTANYNTGETGTGPLSAMRDRSAVTTRWAARDENGDELIFDVYIRGDGEKNWRLLRSRVTDRFYSFDSIRVPDGGYRIRVVASDAPSHVPGDALTGERESDHFIIDTTPPAITGLTGSLQGGTLHASFVATDATSPITRAEYSLDTGRWQVLEPTGKLSDSLTEHYELSVPLNSIPQRSSDLETPGAPPADAQEHILTVRVYDRYDNAIAAKTVIH